MQKEVQRLLQAEMAELDLFYQEFDNELGSKPNTLPSER